MKALSILALLIAIFALAATFVGGGPEQPEGKPAYERALEDRDARINVLEGRIADLNTQIAHLRNKVEETDGELDADLIAAIVHEELDAREQERRRGRGRGRGRSRQASDWIQRELQVDDDKARQLAAIYDETRDQIRELWRENPQDREANMAAMHKAYEAANQKALALLEGEERERFLAWVERMRERFSRANRRSEDEEDDEQEQQGELNEAPKADTPF